MHANITRRRILPVFLVLVGLAAIYSQNLSAVAQETHSIFLTVLDGKGQPVTDLRQDEIALAERDDSNQPVEREITSVKISTQPLAVVLLADTSNPAKPTATRNPRAEIIQDIRGAFSAFVKTMGAASPESQMELMEFGQAAVTIQPMTSNIEALEKGITRVYPKFAMPAVMLEAISAGAKTLGEAKTPRRAIVAMNILPTDEQSRQQPNRMLQDVVNANAQVWVVSYNSGTTAQDPRGVVFDALTKNTGGRRETIASTSALSLYMANVARALANQYEVTFVRPAGAKPKLLQVGVTRSGLSLHTSIYPPR